MKRTASVAKKSKSNGSSHRPASRPASVRRRRHVVCVANRGYPASLEKRKIYTALVDTHAARLGLMRVIDESGGSYLYPKHFFFELAPSRRLDEALSARR